MAVHVGHGSDNDRLEEHGLVVVRSLPFNHLLEVVHVASLAHPRDSRFVWIL